MDMQQLNEAFEQRMRAVQEFVEGNDIKDIIGVEATDHFKGSFDNEGFTDEKLEKWDDVERRDKNSPWYGHSGQTGKFSPARAQAKVLSGETKELASSLSYKHTDKGVRVTNSTPYASVHQFGKMAKIYGKKAFQMIARPFMGKSVVMINNTKAKIVRELTKILKQ